MDKIKVAIADDHALYRLGIQTVIAEKMDNAKLVGQFSSGQELLVHLEMGVHPDIVLLDIIMPGIDGIQTARKIKQNHPDIKIIILSAEVRPDVVNELLDIKVDGYLSKLAVKDDIVNAISSVYQGNIFYGQDIANIIYDTFVAHTVSVDNSKKVGFTKDPDSPLTARELEVVHLVCDGLSTIEIADHMGVSKRTVENHKTNAMQKLGFHTTIDLVKYAIAEGIITL